MIDDFISNSSLSFALFLPIYDIQTFGSSDDVHKDIEPYHVVNKRKKKEGKGVEHRGVEG